MTRWSICSPIFTLAPIRARTSRTGIVREYLYLY
ncbi:hypothetical protein TSAR_001459 [Trichomalopsis sarcophagae]|uniref:Uncharacterized protein n=1 Tax=Trichomalopsis sarcophagae TaxID=543379 RepID=A0A232EGQ2_9HYME|nr:hypothetical protein TSAR_001459 [Trichomalopsis sarcophagae]